MIRTDYKSRDEWLIARETKATGSKIKDLAVKPRTQGVQITDDILANVTQVKLAAEFLTVYDAREGVEWRNAAERGLFLEPEALAAGEKLIGLEFERMENVLFERDDRIVAVSPDGITKSQVAGAETKCLNSGSHLLAILGKAGNENAKNLLLNEYKPQIAQYFCVFDKLETMYAIFYDPRFIKPEHRTIVLKFDREELKEEIEKNTTVIENSKTVVKAILKGVI